MKISHFFVEISKQMEIHDHIMALSEDELRKELEKRNQDTTGLIRTLRQRLKKTWHVM